MMVPTRSQQHRRRPATGMITQMTLQERIAFDSEACPAWSIHGSIRTSCGPSPESTYEQRPQEGTPRLSRPTTYPPRPAYSQAPPMLPQPPPVRDYVFFYPPPRRLQQWHNPFIQPPFRHQPRNNYSYRSGQEYYGPPSRPDLVPNLWYYSSLDARRGFPYSSTYPNCTRRSYVSNCTKLSKLVEFGSENPS